MGSKVQTATAFAPASIGNVGVGFDVLGLAMAGVGDRVTAVKADHGDVRVTGITANALAAGAEKLSRDRNSNTASIAAYELLSDLDMPFGVDLTIEKGIPLTSGMGSSAASAVAAAVAVNALLDEPLTHSALLPYAMAGEAFASKALHADNVAPSLFGGLVFCPPRLLPETLSLSLPDGIVSIVVHPDLVVNTAESRGGLAREVLLTTSVEQNACLAGFVAACYRNDSALMAQCLRDFIIEPQRAEAVKGFDSVKAAALAGGALGCSLSGSGPSVFALAPEASAAAIRTAMVNAFTKQGLAAEGWISVGDAKGAEVLAQ